MSSLSLEEALRKVFDGSGMDSYLPIFAKYARPAVGACVPSREVFRDEIPVGKSRLGGRPDVPVGFEWPGEMDFLIQLNLNELREVMIVDEFPSSGMLYVFYGKDRKGTDEGKLVYVPEAAGPLSRSDRANHEERLVSGRPLTFAATWSLPDIHSLAFRDMLVEAPLQYDDSEESEVDFYDDACIGLVAEHSMITMFGHARCSHGGYYPEEDHAADVCVSIHEFRQHPEYRQGECGEQRDPTFEGARKICAQWTHLFELWEFYEDVETKLSSHKFTWGDQFTYQFWIHNDDLDGFKVDEALGVMV